MLLALVRLVKLKRRRALAAVADVALLKGIIHWWKFTIVTQYPESIFWWILNFVGLLLFDDFDDASDNRYSCNLLENRLSLKSRAGPMTMAVLGESFACRYIEWCTWFVLICYFYICTLTYQQPWNVDIDVRLSYDSHVCSFFQSRSCTCRALRDRFESNTVPLRCKCIQQQKAIRRGRSHGCLRIFFNLLLTDCWRYQQKIWTEPSARKRYKCFSD